MQTCHQAETAANGVLQDALGKALGQSLDGARMVEELMGDIVEGAAEEMVDSGSMAAAMQSVATPAIFVRPTQEEATLLAAGLPCQPAGLGEIHTVQLIDLDQAVSGGGAWVYVQVSQAFYSTMDTV